MDNVAGLKASNFKAVGLSLMQKDCLTPLK